MLTATTLVGCNQTSVLSADSNTLDAGEQNNQGGGGSANDNGNTPDDTAVSNAIPTAAALCVSNPGSVLGLNGSVAGQINDADNTVFNFTVTQAPARGSVQLDLSTGDFNYLPTVESRGYKDSFTYKVDDLNGGIAEGTVDLVYGALRIMPLGNSITYGVTGYTSATGDQPSADFAVGYRQSLYESLVSEGYMVDFVGDQQAGSKAGLADPDHQGMPGWTSWQISDAITDWLDTNPSDVVLAHVGTNDHQVTTDGINSMLNNLNNWSANNGGLKTLLATIVDQRPDTFFEDTVEEFNSNLAELLYNSWPSVSLVDQYSVIDNEVDLTPLANDSVGLHPTTGGYEKMATVWFDALKGSGKLNKCP